jgi:hypothetical protein
MPFHFADQSTHWFEKDLSAERWRKATSNTVPSAVATAALTGTFDADHGSTHRRR